MTDDRNELRHINWAEVFAFTHIFKSRQIATHPTKMLLALSAIILVFAAGLVMDRIWSLAGQYSSQQEIFAYANMPREQFNKDHQAWKDARPTKSSDLLAEARNQAYSLDAYVRRIGYGGQLVNAFRANLSAGNSELDRIKPFKPSRREDYLDQAERGWKGTLQQAEKVFADEVERIGDILGKSHRQVSKDISSLPEDQQDSAEKDLAQSRAQAQLALTERKLDFYRQVQSIRGEPIFASWIHYQGACVGQAVAAVLRADFISGAREYLARERGILSASLVGEPFKVSLPSERPGLLYWLLMMANGLCWMVSRHVLYASIFLLFGLAVWAIFGGAIHRIAALHAAREEKISMSQALRFALSKFFSFLTTPLIPLAIILVLGLLTAAGGLVGNIPAIGPVLTGAMFFLAIGVGLLVAFLGIGLVAGAGLMYPTIAVEGSDSFDAISRSFTYVFSRPWRALLYGLVALVYGTLCYLFVRLFAFLALSATHRFVGWGVFAGGQSLGAGADRLDVMWSAPTFERLYGGFNWLAMTPSEKIGAFFLAIWVLLIVGAVAAFLLSFLASSTTIIYCLLRRIVDATDLDDVYIEEEQADQAPAAPAPPAAPQDQTAQEPAPPA